MKMDCLDGPGVLEGEVVVAILSPLPVWFGCGYNFYISGRIEHGQQSIERKCSLPLRQSITFQRYIIMSLNCVRHKLPSGHIVEALVRRHCFIAI